MKWYVGEGPRLSYFLKEIDHRAPGVNLPLLAVSTNLGVVRKTELANSVSRADNLDKYKVVVTQDLVLNRFNAYRGALGVAREPGLVSPDYSTLRVVRGDSRYFDYWFRSSQVANAMKATMGGLGAQDPDSSGFSRVDVREVLKLRVHVSDVESQRAIADFLDRELSQIDLLIQKQKLLKQLGSERRQATISKLVTHGQRASNSHWHFCRLKDVANIFASNVDKKTYDDGVQVRLCNYVDVYYNDRIVNELPFMEATASLQEIKKFQLKSGWVIATKDSESASDIGIAAYVEKNLPGVVCGYHLAILEPLNDLDGLFLKYFLDCSETKNQLAQRATGLTRVGLGKNDFGTLRIQLPPLDEQVSIAQEITAECEKIDRLGSQTDELIAKLQERRRALINSAVTGKIDVRGKI